MEYRLIRIIRLFYLIFLFNTTFQWKGNRKDVSIYGDKDDSCDQGDWLTGGEYVKLLMNENFLFYLHFIV